MPDSPDASATNTRRRTQRSYLRREGRAEGIPLHVKRPKQFVHDHAVHYSWAYEPSFPLVFITKGLQYGMAWDVFNTHYLQRGKYGRGALMDLTHYGLWMHLQFLASHGEKFYAADVAANLGCDAKRGATKAHTVGRWLDRLENLKLVQRIRNGNSRDRFISVLLSAPFHPDVMPYRGPELMERVETGFVEIERKEAGPGRWPFMIWDAEMVRRHLAGEVNIVERVGAMQDMISMVMRNIDSGTYVGAQDVGSFEDLVKQQCLYRNVPFSPKVFLTAMTWRRLNAKPRKEAPL